jgi:hypothetical protein
MISANAENGYFGENILTSATFHYIVMFQQTLKG